MFKVIKFTVCFGLWLIITIALIPFFVISNIIFSKDWDDFKTSSKGACIDWFNDFKESF